MHWTTIAGAVGIAGIIIWLTITELRAALRRDNTALAFIHGCATRPAADTTDGSQEVLDALHKAA